MLNKNQSHAIAADPVRRALLRAAAAAAAAGPFGLARAQEAGAVRLVVPFTPGTTPDLCARLLSPAWQRRFNRSFVVDNRPGASGMLGMDAVTKSPADGSTLLFGTNTMLTLPFVYAKVPFDVLAFAPVGLIGATNFALVAHPSVPAENVRAFVDWARSQANPPEYASPGKGTFQHLTMEWIAHRAGIKLTHVPYKGSAPALTDLLGGHIKAGILPLHVAAPLAAQRKLRILGATRREPDAAFPGVPSLHAAGIDGFDVDAWYAVWGPAGLSPEWVGRYNEALRASLADAEVQSALQKQGVTIRTSTPEALDKLSREEHAKWGALIKAIKLPQE